MSQKDFKFCFYMINNVDDVNMIQTSNILSLL